MRKGNIASVFKIIIKKSHQTSPATSNYSDDGQELMVANEKSSFQQSSFTL